jgi:cytochrome c peroxidase
MGIYLANRVTSATVDRDLRQVPYRWCAIRYRFPGIALILLPLTGVIALTLGQTTSPFRNTSATTQSDSAPVNHLFTPRPELTDAEYARQAADLRGQYSKPPEQWPPANVDPGVEFHEIGRLPKVQYPVDNPYDKAKEDLGQELFFDPRLSGSGEIACASCHDPDLAWADGRTVSFGHLRHRLRRNAPSIMFSAYEKTLFWDGRADSLEQQIHSPVTTHTEMDGTPETIVQRLNAVPEYRAEFKAVFGTDDIVMDQIVKALATFERSVAKDAGRSLFDRFLGGRTKVLSDSAVRGLHLFRTTARCIECHNGPLFTDGLYHNLGLSQYGQELQDLGRYEITHDPADVGKFRTPTLRNVVRTRPYMHSGLMELDGVISSYNSGMPTLTRTAKFKDDPLFPTKDPLLKPLGLNSVDKADLKAFLDSLSEPPQRMRPPPLPGLDSDPGYEKHPTRKTTATTKKAG